MKKKIIGFIIFTLILNFNVYSENKIFLSYKIENEIITNIDIKNESRYLLALNSQLKNLANEKILEIAEVSLIRETVKKIELLKYIDLDEDSAALDGLIKSFYLKLNLNNQQEFEKYLSNFDLTFKDVKKKIYIEMSWNQMIVQRYQNQIKINYESLEKKIDQQKSSESTKSYRLSEIVFEKKKTSLNDTFKKIEESIKEIGFKNTANIYSVSESAKFGGDLSWVNEKNLSEKLSVILNDLTVGNHTKEIQIGNKFLILKLDEIKNEKIKIDKKKELKKMIEYEKNRQLEQFSKIYYDKVKINTTINEL
jgi:peptidyl-prolyl cis-trans isomerase SurA